MSRSVPIAALVAGLAVLALSGCEQPGDGQAPAPVESLVPLPSEQPAPPVPAAEASAMASTAPSAGATEAGPVKPDDDACGVGKLGAYLNQLPTTDVLDKIREKVGHDRIRAIKPGDAVTQDMRPDRLNIEIGDDGRIKRLRCY